MTDFRFLPQPKTKLGNGHLQDWALKPIPLIEEGAAKAKASKQDLFRLRLGLPAVVGFSPDWNKRVLTDLPTFVSAGSFSKIVPYLSGGVILSDTPEHITKRKQLNPGFTKRELASLQRRTRLARPAIPLDTFDALAWADHTVLRLLNAAYFSSEFNESLLHSFLAPLRQPFPIPALPRPLLFKRVQAELEDLAKKRKAAPQGDLITFLARLPDGLEETRISLAAAHDTTTHALAYAIWHIAKYPQWHNEKDHPAVLKETLRLYAPGWMGSRRLSQSIEWQGIQLPKGTLALYSPYLSARDPDLWEQPTEFQPERWQNKPPAWAYLPFGGGERLCLGMHLAQMLILDVLAELPALTAIRGNAQPQPGVTLGPKGPLWVRRR